jgi:hypothetical protein
VYICRQRCRLACRVSDGSEVVVFRIGRSGVVLIVIVLLASGVACREEREPSSSALPTPGLARTSTRLPTPTAGPNELRPPELVLVTSGAQSVGVVAANAWYDPTTETLSGFEFAGRVILAINPLEWLVDSEIRFELRDSPYPVGTTDIALFRYEENTAMLADAQGKAIGSNPAFVKRTDPVSSITLDGESLSLSRPDEHGVYIVDVTIRWPLSDEVAAELHEEAKTEYVFVVVVR